MQIFNRGRFRFGVIPVIHGKNGAGFGSLENLAFSLRNFQPRLICVEADAGELAVARGDEVGGVLRHKEAVAVGIDPSQLSTRRRLVQRMLGHPIQALRAFRLETSDVSNAKEAAEWRARLEETSPVIFETIYREREEAMVSEIALAVDDEVKCRLNDDVDSEIRVAVVVGAGHCEGVCRLLDTVDLQDVLMHAVIAKDASQRPLSPVPLIVLFYLVLPLCLLGPWPYLVAYLLKPGNFSNGQSSTNPSGKEGWQG